MNKLSFILMAGVLCFGNSVVSAQLVWNEVQTPAPVKQFVTSPDGSLYFTSGDVQSSRLYYSSNRGISWQKIYEGQIQTIACDSSGYLYVADSLLRHTRNWGQSWYVWHSPWYESYSYLACSNSTIYIANPGGFAYRYHDMSWDTVAEDRGNIADWAGLYAGSFDRMVAATGFDGSFSFRQMGISVGDTEDFIRLCPTDNDPIYNAVFASDGYTYIWHCSILARLPAGSKRWEVYRDSVGYNSNSLGHIPLAAIGPALISVEPEGTFISTDHGENWTNLGSGIATSDARRLRVAFTNTGYGYVVSNDTLYRAEYFAAAAQILPVEPTRVYPNPAHSMLHVDAEPGSTIEIDDILGRPELQVRQAEEGLNISSLPSGLHTVRISSGGECRSAVFLKE